ncbi:MAG: hypothetical protein O7F71_20605 [Gammaproteobacteria bacterium]|nr:hypothetical protein [Gammaproteobacteria bacterium]
MLARGLLHQPVALIGVIFLRKSPERLTYSRRRLLLAIGLACPVAYVSHAWLLGLDTPHALMKMVCELTVLVIGLRLARLSQQSSGSTSQYRLLVMTLTLFLISIFGDSVLVALSFVPLETSIGPVRQVLAFTTMISMAIGATNTLQYGMSVSWRMAAVYVLGYITLALMLYEVTSLALMA